MQHEAAEVASRCALGHRVQHPSWTTPELQHARYTGLYMRKLWTHLDLEHTAFRSRLSLSLQAGHSRRCGDRWASTDATQSAVIDYVRLVDRLEAR